MNIILLNKFTRPSPSGTFPSGASTLVELPPGPRTLSWKCPDGEIHFIHVHFPWTYFFVKLLSIKYYNNANETSKPFFAIIDFKVYTSQEKLQNNNGEYLLTGSEIIFPNIANEVGFGYTPCLGHDFQYPMDQNLPDTLTKYLDAFLQIPFSSAWIGIKPGNQNIHLSNLKQLPVGNHQFSFSQTIDKQLKIESIYPEF